MQKYSVSKQIREYEAEIVRSELVLKNALTESGKSLFPSFGTHGNKCI